MRYWVEARKSIVTCNVFSVHRELGAILQDIPNSGLSLNDLIFILMLFADDMVVLANNVLELHNNSYLLYINRDYR